MDTVLLIVLIAILAVAVGAAYVYKLSKKDPAKLDALAADAKTFGNRMKAGLDKVAGVVTRIGDKLR